jgi:hypothetical protein
MKAFSRHKSPRQEALRGKLPEQKMWYASDKPTLFDIITIVARKR